MRVLMLCSSDDVDILLLAKEIKIGKTFARFEFENRRNVHPERNNL